MSATTRTIQASPERVWSVLADGWSYPLWVVGASRMRDVDAQWPAPGTRLHHSVGSWPVLIDDSTEVLEATPGALLRLRARAWPAGEADVVLRLDADGEHTVVQITEDVASGPARLLPGFLRHPALHRRNVETLRRLAYVVERRG